MQRAAERVAQIVFGRDAAALDVTGEQVADALAINDGAVMRHDDGFGRNARADAFGERAFRVDENRARQIEISGVFFAPARVFASS